ncbi:acyl-CoA N-acyltransferase, partial [Trametes cingulata]
DPIALETDINHSEVNSQDLLRAWEHLSPHSVESTLAGYPGLYGFGDAHCLFIAAILWSHEVPPATAHNAANPSVGYPPPLAGSSTSNPKACPPTLPRLCMCSTFPLQIQTPLQEATKRFAAAMGEAVDDSQEEIQMVRVWDTVGIAYITSSAIPNQVHIGVGVSPRFRGKGIGKQACELALRWAFDTLQIHRVEARIMTSACQHRARSLFASLGFSHEGVHRRVVTNSAGEWVDVAYMAMLDTDWTIHTRLKSSPKSLWDELLERHQRERDELLRLEERHNKLRRTSSMETVR